MPRRKGEQYTRASAGATGAKAGDGGGVLVVSSARNRTKDQGEFGTISLDNKFTKTANDTHSLFSGVWEKE